MEEVGLDAGFWRAKRVLVTGHTGFKGSWCCIWLRRLGADVSGYALPPDTEPNLFTAADVQSQVASRMADVRDRESVRDALAGARPEIVLHMAAQPLVRASYDQPAATYATNVLGTANVLDAARRCDSVRAVVVVTSDKCYDLHVAGGPHAEDDRLGGSDPYSASKAAAELVSASMRAAFFASSGAGGPACGVATARGGNIIGGGDWARDRLLPDLIASFVRGEPAAIRNPESIRPWQHVLDALRGYLVLAQRLFQTRDRYAQAWNFGPPDAHAREVSWVADGAAARWGDGARWQRDRAAHPAEAPVLRLDSSKARRELDWETRLGFEDALDWSVAWYGRFHAGAAARALVEADIERYEALVRA